MNTPEIGPISVHLIPIKFEGFAISTPKFQMEFEDKLKVRHQIPVEQFVEGANSPLSERDFVYLVIENIDKQHEMQGWVKVHVENLREVFGGNLPSQESTSSDWTEIVKKQLSKEEQESQSNAKHSPFDQLSEPKDEAVQQLEQAHEALDMIQKEMSQGRLYVGLS